MIDRRLRLVTGDTPNIELAVSDKRTGLPIDVSDALTVCVLKTRPITTPPGGGTVQSVTCSKLVGREVPGGIDSLAPYDVAGKGGRVLAACSAAVFPTAGEYEGELQVTFGATSQVATPYARVLVTVRDDFD